MPYEKIIISGNGYITFDALKSLSQNNRNVILTDTSRNPVCLMNCVRNSLTTTKYKMGQYDTFRDESKRKYLVKQIISAKKESQLKFLKMIKSNITSLPEKEHLASIIYFKEFAKSIPEKYQFTSRNQSFIRNSKTKATDIINALLNYGYAVLSGEISKFVCGIGLDPYYGFMHKTHTSSQSLSYDLIEPFRWMVDETVFHMANSDDKRRKIKLKDYAFAKNGQIVLDYRLKQRFLEKLERNFQKERLHPFKHGKNSKTLSMCQEITIVKIIVQDLADFCLCRSQSFLEDNH